MTKIQMIMEIVNSNDEFTYEELRKLWHAELKILHHAVTKEGYKKDELVTYNLEETDNG